MSFLVYRSKNDAFLRRINIDNRRGSRRFEMLMSATVVCVLATFLLDRMMSYKEYAERAAMETTVRNMRSGLLLKQFDLMMRDQKTEMIQLAQENPVTWLDPVPLNYAGAMPQSARNTISPGSWYFDLTLRELIYIPRHTKSFVPGPDGDLAVHLRVSMASQTENINLTPDAENVQGLILKVANQYQWY